MQQVVNPIPIWRDRQGNALNGGNIRIGVAGQDPVSSPVAVYWDAGLTQEATQPLRVVGGYVRNGAAAAQFFIGEDNYSVRVSESDGDEVFYLANAIADGTSFQAQDSDLTAIAALSTTAFGRSLLTLANQTALANATGITPGLSTNGGAMTGDITRTGAGIHIYLADGSGVTSGELHVIENGAAKPSTGIVFEKSA